MITRASRGTTTAVALALLLFPLAACSAGSTPSGEEPAAEAPAAEATEAAGGGAASGSGAETGEMFGCTQGILDYVSDKGYPSPEPLDPATLAIPAAAFDQAPDCYLVDEDGGRTRYGAFWTSDPQGALTSLGASLDAAGYVQSEDYGPLVWWLNGDDPATAETQLNAAPQPIDGVETLWASWVTPAG
jgi:hypothetical protein